MIKSYTPNVESMQEYLKKEVENSSGGPTWWNFPSGMSSVRILPPWDPTGRVALPVYMHPIEFQGKGMKYKKYSWTCTQRTFNKPCQICEGLSKLQSAGIDISPYEATRVQYYFNAIVMNDPSSQPIDPGTHVLLRAPKTFYNWVISQITNPMVGDITNLESGIDILVTKEGTGLGTTYTMTLSPNGRTGVPKEYLDKIEDLYNLDDIFSSGFDQSQIDELMGSLNKSAQYASSNLSTTLNQMGGYQTGPFPGYPYPPTSIPVDNRSGVAVTPAVTPLPYAPFSSGSQSVPTPSISMENKFSTEVKNPYAQYQDSSAVIQDNPYQLTADPILHLTKNNRPNCYGKYDAGSVNCVVCTYEADCSKDTQ